MPYPKNHKQQTRQAILQEASKAFKVSRIHSVSVPKIMKEVGLTHGGFYAHFKSKDELVAETCRVSMEHSVKKFEKLIGNLPKKDSLIKIVETYISEEHIKLPEKGCILPALGSEVKAETEIIREAYTDALSDFVKLVRTLLPEDKNYLANGIVSTMVGSVLLARSVTKQDFSSEILLDCRKQLIEQITLIYD
ncbi:hypothetical protein BTR23_25130 [Alkalihalophilus pseudofirmus]|nr:hypothetical protein BTR23_25130 [Alkalihalophilus pseudofirmus]